MSNPYVDLSSQASSTPSGGSLGATSPFASQGEVRQNSTYIGNRLMYSRNGDVETIFENLVGGREILNHLRWVAVGQGIILLLMLGLGFLISNDSDLPGFIQGLGELSMALYYPALLAFTIFCFVSFKSHPVSDWELLLDGFGDRAESSFIAIRRALAERKIAAEVDPFIMPEVSEKDLFKFYIVVRQGKYVGLITARPYGTGLYLAWSLRYECRYWRLYLIGAKQAVGSLFKRTAGLSRLMEMEVDRALRETLHNCVRDGVESAVTGVAADLPSTLPPAPVVLTIPRSVPPRPPRHAQSSVPPPGAYQPHAASAPSTTAVDYGGYPPAPPRAQPPPAQPPPIPPAGYAAYAPPASHWPSETPTPPDPFPGYPPVDPPPPPLPPPPYPPRGSA
ncbi:MAG: hypothetical protein ACRC0L_11135 [Angustibacter sp.]